MQIKRFLENLGCSGQVPPWMPSRPLLLGTLFACSVVPCVIAGTTLPFVSRRNLAWRLLPRYLPLPISDRVVTHGLRF